MPRAKKATKRWWVSWYEPQPDGDHRPRKWPLANGVIAYWCSGFRSSDGAATLCAVVDAPTEKAARNAVTEQGWSPESWRFTDPRPDGWMPAPDRFPAQKEALDAGTR